MATIYVWEDGGGMSYPTGSLPEFGVEQNSRHQYMGFDATADETIFLDGVAPQNMTGTLTLVAYGYMPTVNSNSVVAQARVEAIAPGDSLNMMNAVSFDSFNTQTQAVPGTTGDPFSVSITLTNRDSIVAGEIFRIEFGRDADNGSDNAAGDWRVIRVELRDSS